MMMGMMIHTFNTMMMGMMMQYIKHNDDGDDDDTFNTMMMRMMMILCMTLLQKAKEISIYTKHRLYCNIGG